MHPSTLLPLLAAASALALPATTQKKYPPSCPTTFAVSLGPSITDGREAFFWLDNTDWIRAISTLDIDTPSRATFLVKNSRLYSANNTQILAKVPPEGGVIEFHPPGKAGGKPIFVTAKWNAKSQKCHATFASGNNTFISMQNYKGWLHLTSDPNYSNRQWGSGPFELLPFPVSPIPTPTPTPAVAPRQASPAPGAATDQLDPSLCPLSSFALSTGPSKTDGRTAYPWLDLLNMLRANTNLAISTPERSAFALVDGALHPAVVNTSYVASVATGGGGTIYFRPSSPFASPSDGEEEEEGWDVVSAKVARVESKDGGGVRCFVSLTAGEGQSVRYLSMQNYKGYMHLTDRETYSSRYWGEGPWEMVPFEAPWDVPERLAT
ncbi:hypothetical protein BDZ85DRAFT_268351 [Elsinoe ampelina]|uniref:Uncharacterized protein n=1 Tax=Elsinoe ampelina TaxID=302913 RepID=A0A6A6G2C7_9PEZI|nr:hypothetical protein BDZ85DRAFT_268351 [Elsinoe ampelina]